MPFENLDEVAEKLGDGGPYCADTVFNTVEELVDGLVGLAQADHIHAFHDDYLGLKSDLTVELLQSPIDEVDEDKHAEEISLILDQAERIISLNERELTEEDEAAILEDRQSRGEDDDD